MKCPLRLFYPRSLARAPARPVAQASQRRAAVLSRPLLEQFALLPISSCFVVVPVVESDSCQLYRFNPLFFSFEVVVKNGLGGLGEPVLIPGKHPRRASGVFV